jgi:hypothetical protein
LEVVAVKTSFKFVDDDDMEGIAGRCFEWRGEVGHEREPEQPDCILNRLLVDAVDGRLLKMPPEYFAS